MVFGEKDCLSMNEFAVVAARLFSSAMVALVASMPAEEAEDALDNACIGLRHAMSEVLGSTCKRRADETNESVH